MNLTTILSSLGISTRFTQDITLLIVVVLLSFIFGIFIGNVGNPADEIKKFGHISDRVAVSQVSAVG